MSSSDPVPDIEPDLSITPSEKKAPISSPNSFFIYLGIIAAFFLYHRIAWEALLYVAGERFEGQVKSSLALAVDNYHKLKANYPNLSEDEIIDLTTLMHNSPGKALEPRYVNYYLKRNDVDYLNKVKSFRPKSFTKAQTPSTKKSQEIKFEEISPEKAKSMADYVKSLEKPKRNGGRVGINDLDAQPKKKLNQLLNFTNNPDKNWLDNLQ
jgi:hypothetical protein